VEIFVSKKQFDRKCYNICNLSMYGVWLASKSLEHYVDNSAVEGEAPSRIKVTFSLNISWHLYFLYENDKIIIILILYLDEYTYIKQ